jgi:hypothetical protein
MADDPTDEDRPEPEAPPEASQSPPATRAAGDDPEQATNRAAPGDAGSKE